MNRPDNYFVMTQNSWGNDRASYTMAFGRGFVSIENARAAIEKDGLPNQVYVITGLMQRAQVEVTRRII